MQNRDAWQTYRTAFEQFSSKARHVQSLTHTGADLAAIELGLIELERARLDYNSARDQVAQQLLPSLPKPQPEEENSVRGIARLLWEVAGQPEGTAHEDWFRAEKIVQRAAAA